MLDLLVSQTGKPPFDPRAAVRKFAEHLAGYGLNRVTGDAYAGQTFRADFEAAGIAYSVAPARTTDIGCGRRQAPCLGERIPRPGCAHSLLVHQDPHSPDG